MSTRNELVSEEAEEKPWWEKDDEELNAIARAERMRAIQRRADEDSDRGKTL